MGPVSPYRLPKNPKYPLQPKPTLVITIYLIIWMYVEVDINQDAKDEESYLK